MKREKNSWCYPQRWKAHSAAALQLPPELVEWGLWVDTAAMPNAWGASALYKTLITGSTVTLPTESLIATKSCGLLFPSPLLHTQSSSATPMKYLVHFIPPHLQAWFLGEIGEQFHLYRHFSGLILNPGWCDVKGSNTLKIFSLIPIFYARCLSLKSTSWPLLHSLCRVPWDSWSGVQPNLPWHGQLWSDVLREGLRHLPRQQDDEVRVQIPLVLCCALPGLPGSGGHSHLQSAKERCLDFPDMTHRLLMLRTTAFALPGLCRSASEVLLLLCLFCLCCSLHRSCWKNYIKPAAFTLHFCMTVLLQSCLCINRCISGRTYLCQDSSNHHVTLLQNPCGNSFLPAGTPEHTKYGTFTWSPPPSARAGLAQASSEGSWAGGSWALDTEWIRSLSHWLVISPLKKICG